MLISICIVLDVYYYDEARFKFKNSAKLIKCELKLNGKSIEKQFLIMVPALWGLNLISTFWKGLGSYHYTY